MTSVEKQKNGTGTVKENPGTGLRSEPLSLSKSVLSLEPALIIHLTSAFLVLMSVSDLLLEKACRVNLGYSDEVCDALQARDTDKYKKEEQAVQALMGQALMWRNIVENIFPIFLVFFVGAWTDKYGRKYPMLAVIVSFILQDVILIGTVIAGKLAGIWTVAMVSSLIISLSGNQACFISSAFSYISDHTPVDKRTVRTGVCHTLFFLGLTVGIAAGGILAKSGLGFVKIFAIAAGLELFALVYLTISMKNQPLPGATKGKTVMQMFMELFDFQLIKDAGKCIVKKREGNTRLKLGLLILSHCCVLMPMRGEMGVMYLFCRLKFNWDGGEFGSFMTYTMIVGFLGNFVSMGILAGKLKLTDPQNGIVAAVSNLVAALIFAAANSSAMMVAAPLIRLFAGAAMIVPRSMLSKLIPSEDQGKINSCIASLESILPLVGSALYTSVYTSSLDVYPGSFFLLSAALMTPPIFVYWWFMQNEESTKKKQ